MFGKSLISSGALAAVMCASGCYGAGDDAPVDDGGTDGDASTGGMMDDGGPVPTTADDDGDGDGTPGDDDGTTGDDGMPGDDGSTGGPEPGTDTGEPTDDTSDDGSTGEPGTDEAPTVLSVAPADGEMGVMPDVPIVVTFSEPMHKAATQAAYQSTDIPAASVTFSWNEAGDELTITPNEPLEWAEGEDPDAVAALSYAYSITTAATDLAGNELEADHDVEFSTIRQILQPLPLVADLSGSLRADGFLANTYMFVGDSGAATSLNAQYKGFLSFEVSGLPAGITEIQGAELYVYQTSVQGSPYAGLGDLVAYDLEFATMDVEAFGAPVNVEVGVLSNAVAPGWRVLDVGTLVADDYEAAHDATQFRLEFPTATNFDGEQDVVRLETTFANPAALYILYLLP